MRTATQAQAARDRAREARLKSASEHRLNLDPDQVARDKRIDEATVDVGLAWEARAEAGQAVETAEIVAAAAIERLLRERLSAADVVKLTGLNQATVRRLRQTKPAEAHLVSRAAGTWTSEEFSVVASAALRQTDTR